MTAEPSRFHATPADVDQFLRQHLAENTLLRYQQAIGNRAAAEAARDIRMETNSLKAHGVLEHDKFRPCRDAADQIDPLKGGGHWPSELIRFAGQPCPVCDGTGGDHQIGCQAGEG